MTNTTILSCLAMFAFAIGGLALLFYFLYRSKFGAAVITALCLVLGTCAVLVRPSRQQVARAPEPVTDPSARSITSPSFEPATPPPVTTTAATPTATLDATPSTVSPTTTVSPVTQTQAAEVDPEVDPDVQTSTVESAARRRAIARLLLDPKTFLFHEPTCPAARGLSTKASPSVARMQGYRPHACVRDAGR